MPGPTEGSGGISRFGARTGEVPLLDLEELYAGEGSRSGAMPKVSLADISLEETWYDHHNVPPAYRALGVGDGDERMTVSDASVERVLNALDPDESLRNAVGIKPELVAWLAVPVQYEENPVFGYARATVSLVEIDRLTELHAGLGAKLAEMQGEKKPPRTAQYLQRLYSAYQSNGDSPVDKDGPNKPSAGSRGENPFGEGITTLEFKKRFGAHHIYGAVNPLWKPSSDVEVDGDPSVWAGVCRFAASGLASLRTAMSPTWEVSMTTYRPMVMNRI